MTVLDRIGRKLDVLRSHVRNGYQPNYGVVAEPALARPVSCEELREVENEFGVSLPAEYRDFLLRFGDGETGPNRFKRAKDGLTASSRQLFPLSAPFLGCCSPDHVRLNQNEQWTEYRTLLREWELIPHDNGVLVICDYGCAISGRLILNGPFAGNVWLLTGDAAYYGPFGGSEMLHAATVSTDWIPTATPREYSFGEWYESWLDGELKMAAITAS